MYYSSTSRASQSESEFTVKLAKTSLVQPALLISGIGLFFRWAKGCFEGFSTDVHLIFIPQEAYGFSLKLLGTCLVSVATGLLTGVVSDWFYPKVKETRILTIW